MKDFYEALASSERNAAIPKEDDFFGMPENQGRRVHFLKPEGLLSKNTREGVSDDLNHRIADQLT